MGHVRPSVDIDFEIRLTGRKPKHFREKLEEAVLKAARECGTAVNYSENVAGWSMISFLDYRKTAVPYRTFGKIRVDLIAPEFWTIGKMARFLALDRDDILRIIRRKKIPAGRLIRVWARALLSSRLSLELGQFRDHVLDFLKQDAGKAWGLRHQPEKLQALFLKQIRK